MHHANTAEAETTSFPLPQEMLDCSKLYDSQKDFDTRQTESVQVMFEHINEWAQEV